MRLIKAVVAVVLGLVVLAGAALFLLPSERIAVIAAQQFQTATGRSLTIDGAVRPSFYPVIGATANGISIGNADWAGDAPLLQAEQMEIGLDLTALLRGDVQIERIILQSPVIDLRRNSEGRGNWEMAIRASAPPPQSDSTAEPQTRPRAFSLGMAAIAGGQLRFRDAASGTDITLDALDADFALPALDGPAEITAAARVNGQALRLSAVTDNVARLISGAVVGLSLDLGLAESRAQFAGRAGLGDMILEGQLDTDIPALAPVFRALAAQGADLPPAYLPLGFSGRVTRTADGMLYARDARMRAGDTRLNGDIDMSMAGARPKLTGQLSGGVLDLRSRGATGRGTQSGGAAAVQGWSRDVIDASALGLIDADLSLAFDGIQTDVTSFGQTRLVLGIDNSRAVIDLREVAVFGGRLMGQFIANNRSGLSVRADLRARDVALLPMLTELADYRRLQGSANLDINVLGVGNSVHAIMDSLRGDGAIRFDQGEILGFDLAGMLRNLDMSYMGEGTRTVYDSISGTFTVADGVLRNDDLALSAQRFSVTGRGSVALGARTLDYRIVPAALQGEGGEALRVPLMITGPWDAPRFRLDLEALAREQLRVEQERLEDIAREEARRLEDRAREQAAERLERELGVQREEGERLEDTLRRGLEQELGNRLRGLLGGN
ncbi:AsmA family protein [Roseinatronobacter alkalisoli]|uniref:AsmA family protein n=1 Tax=Roseinatronobacter alkalisoli TaxID=3028235 RepID=A0ABT5T556_9RHOB|nr:AsmA family protein [Roseinatronobacter sp. HJB301]MDD7970116.1 AsmA family protein [Roseinatronobacter sp. HJB301]